MLLHEEQQKAIEQILSSFDGRMSQIISEIERLLSRYMLTTPMDTTSTLQFDVAFNQILQEAGYFDMVNRMVDSDYDQLFSLITEGFAAGGLVMNYTAEDLKRVMALKALQVNQFTVIGATAGATLRENLFKYALSNFTIEDMTAKLMDDFKGTNLVKHSRILANTAIKEFQESMIDIAAEGLDGVWLYVGVRDSKNRDFCACVLDKGGYYSDKDKNKLKYSPDRRYNCRHRFRMVSEDFATSNGYTKNRSTSC